MQKVRLLVHEAYASRVLEILQKFGSMEFSEVEENDRLTQREKTSFEFNYVSSRLDFAVEFLSRYEMQSKGKLRAMIEGNKTRISPSSIDSLENNFAYNDVIDRLQDIQGDLHTEQKKIRTLKKEQDLLEKWKDFDGRLGQPFETELTKTICVDQLRQNAADGVDILTVEKILKKENCSIYIQAVGADRGVVTFLKSGAETVQKLLAENGFESVSLPKRRGTPAEELGRIGRAIENAQKRIDADEDEIRKMAKHLPDLRALADSMLWKKEKHNMLVGAQATKSVLVFEGWAKKKSIPAIAQALDVEKCLYSLEEIEPKEGETPPVELENRPSVRPFEVVTRLYGLPSYGDLDPTLYLSGFFFIFFGLCLTDVFYGLFVFLVTATVLHVYRVPKDMQPIIRLLMYGGIASGILGLFFGGYLGLSTEAFPAWLKAIQQFDPIHDPMPFFYLSLVLGFLQVIFGISLKLATQIKNGERADGILDNGPWLLFFVSLALFVLGKAGVSLSIFTEYAIFFLYVSLGLIVVTQGRKEKNILMQLLKGTLGLYDIIGYFSDILSYSRLLALGLATSALAFAVNLIAGIVNDLVPYVGVVFAVLVLIVGHIFNLSVNALSAFIHSARLQFVEFFGKFITGGGREFAPFRREERYVVLEKDS